MPRVLLVEDVEDNRELAREVLVGAGFEVTAVESGADALELAAAESFDIILLDLSLPVLDGWEILRRIRADTHNRRVPVIALTAHVMSGDRERVLEAGFDAYIPKPIAVGFFAQQVRAQLKAVR